LKSCALSSCWFGQRGCWGCFVSLCSFHGLKHVSFEPVWVFGQFSSLKLSSWIEIYHFLIWSCEGWLKFIIFCMFQSIGWNPHFLVHLGYGAVFFPSV
jgi:hypothetical protein